MSDKLFQVENMSFKTRFKGYLKINIFLLGLHLFLGILLLLIISWLGILYLIISLSFEIYLCYKKSIFIITKIVIETEFKSIEIFINKKDEFYNHYSLKVGEFKCLIENSFKGSNPTSTFLIHKRTGKEPILIVKQENHSGWKKEDFEQIILLIKSAD